MEEQTKIKCEICSGEYKNYNALVNHIQNKHHIKKQVYYNTYLKTDPNEGICPICGNPTKFISMTTGYAKHCSCKCSGQDNETQVIRNQTNTEKYGQDYYKELHKRQIDSMLEKYGVENPGQVQEFRDKAKATSLERYGVECNWSSKDPTLNGAQTRLEKYGSECNFSSESSVRIKIQSTITEKYGVDNVFQSEEVKDKIKQTNLEKYGVKYVSQSPEIREKIETTCLEKYGAKNVFESNEIKEQIKKTNLERYGVECTLSAGSPISEKINETNLSKYGSISAFGNKEIQEKSVQTNIEKYGVPYYCMTSDCRISHQGDSYPNLMFKQLLINAGLFVSDEETREFPIGVYSYDFKVGATLIEINPTITHNITFSPYKYSQITPEYHKQKLAAAVNSGYRCICVWDWDDCEKNS